MFTFFRLPKCLVNNVYFAELSADAMDNKQIRVVMRDNNIYMWQVAKKLNVNETSFCKWFREELSEERKQQVMSAIEEIKLDRLKEQK